MQRITVIGASNVDLSATANAPLVAGDSNPGVVKTSFGGVGRNIAENCARLGRQVNMITAYGDDGFALSLQAFAKTLCMDDSHSFIGQNISSSLYICVNQPDGDIAVAVSDMDVCNWVTPAYVAPLLPVINASDAVLLDTNFPKETIEFLGRECTAPLFADSVSTLKVDKLQGILGKLTGLKTNGSEAELLTGIPVHTVEDAALAAQALHDKGVKAVFLTLGSLGALVSYQGETAYLPSMVKEMINTTGCGDAFCAGAVCALLENRGVQDILEWGLGMAALCAADIATVSPRISQAHLLAYIQAYKDRHTEEENSHA